MARGESGRIVIEVEPEVKRRLYAALALSGSTLKDWFIQTAIVFCEDSVQPSLFPSAPGNRPASHGHGLATEQPSPGPTEDPKSESPTQK